MADRENPPERFTLRRWSQRKLAAARHDGDATRLADRGSVSALDHRTVSAADRGSLPGPDHASVATPAPALAPTPDIVAPELATPAPELPPVESLTFESDFTAFLRAGVDEITKRGALKKLFSDPRFNVMDGLDTYIADYSLPDPIDPAIVRQMVSARYIFDPPKTRVNEQDVVEEVPPELIDDATRPATYDNPTPGGSAAEPMQTAPQLPADYRDGAATPADGTIDAEQSGSGPVGQGEIAVATTQTSTVPETQSESR